MTAPTDFRALCAELVNALDGEIEMYDARCNDLIARARAALAAEPEPVEPTDKELNQLWEDLYCKLRKSPTPPSPAGGTDD